MNEKDELQMQKDEAMGQLKEQIAINVELERQLQELQGQAMQLQAAKVDDERRAKIEMEDLTDQRGELARSCVAMPW